MAHSVDVTVVQSFDDLLENDSCIFFIVVFVSDDSVKKFSSSTQFQNKINIDFIFEVVYKSKNVGVVQFHHDFDFEFESLNVGDFCFFNDFNGSFEVGSFELSELHSSIRAFSELVFSELVIVLDVTSILLSQKVVFVVHVYYPTDSSF